MIAKITNLNAIAGTFNCKLAKNLVKRFLVKHKATTRENGDSTKIPGVNFAARQQSQQ
jgi:hypothetical protein